MRYGFFHVPNPTGGRVSVPLLPQCGSCGLHKACRSPKMPVSGGGRKRILIVGESPGKSEDLVGRPFVGKTGQYLAKVVRKIGHDLRGDCWLTNAVICHSPNPDKDDEKAIAHCRPNLVNAVRELNPDVIIPLGSRAVKSVLGWLWKEDVGEIGRWHGWRIPSQEINCWVCPTFHPAFLLRSEKKGRIDPVLEMMLEDHLQRAFDLEGKPWQEIPDYRSRVRVIYDPEEAATWVERVTGQNRPTAFDFETDRLKPDHPDASIYCCSLSNGSVTIAYPWCGKAVTATGEFLKSDVPKVGYNVRFEERWCLRKLGHGVRNWAWDGMLNAHILDNRKDTKSLKFQSFVLFGVGAYDAPVKPFLKSDKGSNSPNRIREADLGKVLEYCGMDSLLEYKVAKYQSRELGMVL